MLASFSIKLNSYFKSSIGISDLRASFYKTAVKNPDGYIKPPNQYVFKEPLLIHVLI